MNDETSKPGDFVDLYRRAFLEYGTQALWNIQATENPTLADALAITRALRTHGGMDGRRLAEQIALNRAGPPFSRDVDIFQDSQQRLETAAEADAQALTEAGFKLSWKTIKTGKREAEVERLGDRMPLEWVADSDFRFFPAQRDELFGYVLHPVDLATNKASAAADRREPRDIVDLLTIHENILPIGAVVCAAVGRFPGQSPEEMLSDI